MSHTLTDVKVMRDTENWEVEIKASVPAESLQKYRAEALKEIQRTATLDGFRPGKAPEDRIVQVYGESAIMREAAEHAVQHELPELLASEKLFVIETPRVSIESPESGKPLPFTAKAALAPTVELADYKKIAQKHTAQKEEITVSDQEVTEALMHLRRERARIDKVEAGTEPQKAAEEARAADEKDLPALDDDFSKSIGYESAKHFEDTLRLNMKEEKTRQAMEKRRSSMLDELVKESKISYPTLLREYEIDDMEIRMKEDLSRMGTTYEAYLTQTKKTQADVRSDWKETADKRAKVRLVLSEIARREKIEPDSEAVAHELEHAKQHYPNADQGALRAHIMHAMRNEATLRFLEGNPEKVGHTAHDHA